MALLGLYVGVIPVALGMLWLPFVRRISESWIRLLIAFTVGLLVVLGVDAGLEGLEIGAAAPSAFGGQALVLLGALVAYLALAGVDSYLSARAARSASPARPTPRPARGAARGGPISPCWSRSGSACTTSARAWRSARPTPSERSPWGPSW